MQVIRGFDRVWFIPTHVGHTRLLGRCSQPLSVHPHTRGAYRRYHFAAPDNMRFIPTHVGHTKAVRPHCTPSAGHPHTRGAYGPRGAAAATGRRFIPTHVGHTGLGELSPGPAAVHPHTRGAYPLLPGWPPGGRGSSPHTWGIHPICWGLSLAPRFIPTHVGHTPSGRPGYMLRTVHPHTRGAYTGPP